MKSRTLRPAAPAAGDRDPRRARGPGVSGRRGSLAVAMTAASGARAAAACGSGGSSSAASS